MVDVAPQQAFGEAAAQLLPCPYPFCHGPKGLGSTRSYQQGSVDLEDIKAVLPWVFPGDQCPISLLSHLRVHLEESGGLVALTLLGGQPCAEL